MDNQGCNSRVFLIKDNALNDEFVLKKIEKNGLDLSELFKEAQILQKCNHPNVAKIQYAGEDSDCIHIDLVMPYYKNGSLKEKITNGKTLSTIETIRYFIQSFQGLSHIHSLGLIHFDIKPDNIMIADSDEAIIADFGLTKYMIDSGVSPDKIYIKHYLPELLVGKKVADHRADIYQMGLTMYRVLNRYYSIEQNLINPTDIIQGNYPDRSKYNFHIPNKLKKIVNKCIEPNPNNRYMTSLDVINELSDISKTNLLFWKLIEKSPNLSIWEQVINNRKIIVESSIDVTRKEGKYKIIYKKVNLETLKEQQIHNFCYIGNKKNEYEIKLRSIFK